ARRLELAGAADARGQHHVRRRAVANADAGLAEPRDLLGVEMDAVRQPDPARHPARFLQKVDRPQAVAIEAELLLVVGLAEMRVQLAVVALGEARALDHEIFGDRERRTG